MSLHFRPLKDSDIERLALWPGEPHVAECWQESERLEELRDKSTKRLPERGVQPFIIEFEGPPIGYIQDEIITPGGLAILVRFDRNSGVTENRRVVNSGDPP